MTEQMLKPVSKHELSDVTSISLLLTGEILFEVTPRENFLQKTQVGMSRNNWAGYVTVARPKILKAIESKEDAHFLYHGNSKVAKVLWRDDNTYQIHLMHYTLKGSINRSLCVYLTQSEWENLEKLTNEITRMQEESSPVGMKTKLFLTGYRWKLNAKEGVQKSFVPECSKVYYRETDAEQTGTMSALKHSNFVEGVDIVREPISLPDEMSFLHKVFICVHYFMCKMFLDTSCNGCAGGLPLDNPFHNMGNEGCQTESNAFLQRYITKAKVHVNDKLVKQAFNDIWKILGLNSPRTLDDFLKYLHFYMDDFHSDTVLLHHMKNLPEFFDSDPTFMLIRDTVQTLVINQQENVLKYEKEMDSVFNFIGVGEKQQVENNETDEVFKVDEKSVVNTDPSLPSDMKKRKKLKTEMSHITSE